jgi:hypothetical protein
MKAMDLRHENRMIDNIDHRPQPCSGHSTPLIRTAHIQQYASHYSVPNLISAVIFTLSNEAVVLCFARQKMQTPRSNIPY